MVYVDENLSRDPDNVKKVACLVWFDRLSHKVRSAAEATKIRLLVETTPCHVPYDPQTVVNTLVQVFGYTTMRAYRRVVPGVQSRLNRRSGKGGAK